MYIIVLGNSYPKLINPIMLFLTSFSWNHKVYTKQSKSRGKKHNYQNVVVNCNVNCRREVGRTLDGDGKMEKEENRRRRQHLGAYPAGPKMEKGKRKKKREIKRVWRDRSREREILRCVNSRSRQLGNQLNCSVHVWHSRDINSK